MVVGIDVHKRSHVAALLDRHRIRHLTTKPYRPRTKRQNLCLKIGVPSGWTARLPAPVGLTQAKGMSRTRRGRCFR